MATMLDGIDYPAVQDPKLWKLKDSLGHGQHDQVANSA